MNESIVWDEVEQKFLKSGIGMVYDNVESSIYLNLNGEVKIHNYFSEYEEDLIYPYKEPNKLIAFPCIGKTDDTPEQNKIYADSSIVEFELSSIIFNGYFTYDNETLRYMIKITKDDTPIIKEDYYLFYSEQFENLKVIGTLQEHYRKTQNYWRQNEN